MIANDGRKYRVFLRELEVQEVRDLSLRMRRITLGGEQLGAGMFGHDLVPAFESHGPDDHVKLFFPDPDTGRVSLPVQDGDYLAWPQFPPAISRDYTPRGFQSGSGVLHIDIMIHGNGIGSDWAAQATPGQRIHIAGPRTSMWVPQSESYLLIGDETALAAIANWLDRIPEGTAAQAHILTRNGLASGGDRTHGDRAIIWHRCDPADPAAMSELAGQLPIGHDTYIWAGGERSVIEALRGHVDRHDLDPALIDLNYFWTLNETQPL